MTHTLFWLLLQTSHPPSGSCLRTSTSSLIADSPFPCDGRHMKSCWFSTQLLSCSLLWSRLELLGSIYSLLVLWAALKIIFCLSACRIILCHWVKLWYSHSQGDDSQPGRRVAPRVPKTKSSETLSLSSTYSTNLPLWAESREGRLESTLTLLLHLSLLFSLYSPLELIGWHSSFSSCQHQDFPIWSINKGI